LIRLFFSNNVSIELLPWLIAIAGVCSVIGHNWSIFMRFGGGAGTGPNVGWGTAVWWPMFPTGIILMVVMLLTVGMASVASMAMAAILIIVFTTLYFLGIHPYDTTLAYMVGGLISGGIVVYALRPNIQRLMNGTERVVGPRAKRIAQREASREKVQG
jgi:glycerol-3-phosphate acyltransferase PlsY